MIDANGQFVMPGIIDCHSHIAIDGDVNEGSISVSSIANTADVLNPEDIDIYRDLAGGVTTANILHGSANPIGGQTVVIKCAGASLLPSCRLKGRCRESNSRSAKTQSTPTSADADANRAIPRPAWAWKKRFAVHFLKLAITRQRGTTTTNVPPAARKI